VTDFGLFLAGQAGQGLETAARVLGRALVRGGYRVLVSLDVMSRIRGGHNACRFRITDEAVRADADLFDALIALSPELAGQHLAELKPDGVVVVDEDGADLPEGEYRILRLPLAKAVKQQGGRRSANMVALGVFAGSVGLEDGLLTAAVREQFAGLGSKVVEENVASCRAGRELASDAGLRVSTELVSHDSDRSLMLLTGAEAIALGAVAGGAIYASGYPMSPGTGVLEALARWSGQTGMVVQQAEDEVAAINQACGASFAGMPAVVATAGGGLSLMNEGLSLAGMTETGLVVCSGMRPGPATGLATRTAQADLLFAITCGHGEFPRAVFCPGDAEQAFQATAKAVRLADEYQTPCIVLFDEYLADAFWTVDGLAAPSAPVAEQWRGRDYAYRRYEVTKSGVSPRLRPGTPRQLVYADSDEHTEEGHITESADVRNRMVEKRFRKQAGLADRMDKPVLYPEPDAAAVVGCFGTAAGVVREAVDRLRAEGRNVAMMSFCDVWPFPVERVRELTRRSKRLVTVEGNFTGQLAQLITQETRLRVDGVVRRYDGRQFRVADVERQLARLLEEEA